VLRLSVVWVTPFTSHLGDKPSRRQSSRRQTNSATRVGQLGDNLCRLSVCFVLIEQNQLSKKAVLSQGNHTMRLLSRWRARLATRASTSGFGKPSQGTVPSWPKTLFLVHNSRGRLEHVRCCGGLYVCTHLRGVVDAENWRVQVVMTSTLTLEVERVADLHDGNATSNGISRPASPVDLVLAQFVDLEISCRRVDWLVSPSWFVTDLTVAETHRRLSVVCTECIVAKRCVLEQSY